MPVVSADPAAGLRSRREDHPALPLTGLDATPVAEEILERLAAFRKNWIGKVGNELQLAQSFLNDLCDALGTSKPTDGSYLEETYQFEKPVGGGGDRGRIDLYKRAHFVLEAKCGRVSRDEPGSAPVRGTKAYFRYIENAFLDQARIYTARLPEGPPPLAIVVDVGAHFWIWRYDGASYGGFHSPRRIDIPLDRVADEDYARVLLACFETPHSLDPSLEQERITKEAAARLAKLATSLDEMGHPPAATAGFLMRCIFCMFAEDAQLLTPNTFSRLLLKTLRRPEAFRGELTTFFQQMDRGGSYDLEKIRRFNGALFKDATALDLDAPSIQALADAASLRWDRVDPSIFGTLLERALDPAERKRLGAHYTPRAYVERVVRPTIEEPLRREWEIVQLQAAEILADESLTISKQRERVAALIRAYVERLSRIRVLDPACGTGNFLYVSYAIVKGLEYEALEALRGLGGAQSGLAFEGGLAVVPDHFKGLEIKPWAAEIAQLVLWIGHLQWEINHDRLGTLEEPILGEQRSIERQDAIISHTGTRVRTDSAGKPVLKWDGKTTLVSPTTGELIPDPSATVESVVYDEVKVANWPDADFIVGNPPFVGNKVMRFILGDGYVDAVRAAYPDIPDTVDYVMYWWHRAAEAVRLGRAERFGFITTNSIRQTFNRQVISFHLDAKPSLGLSAAIADHPWIDETGSAAVRIAMTVGVRSDTPGPFPGVWGRVVSEGANAEDVAVSWQMVPRIHADLSGGGDVGSAVPLKSNEGISFQGMNLVGKGFRVDMAALERMGYDSDNLPPIVRPYLNNRELMGKRKHRMVIDAYGLTAEELGDSYPPLYQWLVDRVKPERDQNPREGRRRRWWLFGETVGRLRKKLVGCDRFFVTGETSKHRVFVAMAIETCPDHQLYAFALDDGVFLGVLSSRPHTLWSLAAGGRQGKGNDPRYNNTRCFVTFPFPEASPKQRSAIGDLADRIDAWRKTAQAKSAEVTLTGLYNIVDKLRSGEQLSDQEKSIHTLVGTTRLLEMHSALDKAVLAAYGWPDDISDATLLANLVELNRKRAAEEDQDLIRWLRPAEGQARLPGTSTPSKTKSRRKAVSALPWPSTLPEQMFAILDALVAADRPLLPQEVAKHFKRAPRAKVKELLESLARRRLVCSDEDGRFSHGRQL